MGEAALSTSCKGLAREGQGVAAGILDRLGIDLEQSRHRRLTTLSQVD